ncbi:hypothetical protein P9112_005885 [Eukaryota sp. TZLM1-RC]
MVLISFSSSVTGLSYKHVEKTRRFLGAVGAYELPVATSTVDEIDVLCPENGTDDKLLPGNYTTGVTNRLFTSSKGRISFKSRRCLYFRVLSRSAGFGVLGLNSAQSGTL